MDRFDQPKESNTELSLAYENHESLEDDETTSDQRTATIHIDQAQIETIFSDSELKDLPGELDGDENLLKAFDANPGEAVESNQQAGKSKLIDNSSADHQIETKRNGGNLRRLWNPTQHMNTDLA